jgi:RNA polymerase sigma-70 factor (ECF subfamily)
MDRRRFSELVEDHHRSVLCYARALAGGEGIARELAQDAFVAAWHSATTFDVTRDFAAWMRGIVRNKWREHCRRSAREVPLDEEALSRLEQMLAPYPDGDAAIFARLAECREKLPAPMAGALRATYDEGRSSEEAAALFDLSPAALRKRLERAREALRLCLARND